MIGATASAGTENKKQIDVELESSSCKQFSYPGAIDEMSSFFLKYRHEMIFVCGLDRS